MDKTKVNLSDNKILKSENVEYKNDTLKKYLDEDLENELYYKSGDVLKNSYGFSVSGYLTGAAKTIEFSIPIDKSLAKINTINFNKAKVNIRHVGGGYIYNQIDLVEEPDVILTIRPTMNKMLNIQLTSQTAYNATNNTPVNIYFYANQFEITFN